MREEVEKNHNKWFKTAEEVAEKIGTEINRPQTSVYQKRWVYKFFWLLQRKSCIWAHFSFWTRYVQWWSNKSIFPETAQSTLRQMDGDLFPNMYILMKILCTLPVTSCECERSISALRQLKSYMRTTMKEDRLNGLALLHVHNDLEINIERVIDIFPQKHPRRLTCSLANITWINIIIIFFKNPL